MANFLNLLKTLPSDFSGTILHFSKEGKYKQTAALKNLGIKPCQDCGKLENLEQSNCKNCGSFILSIR